VFLTGATGFLGKVVIEKLLRTTEVKRIYVLIRPKRGVEIKDRIITWSKDAVSKAIGNLKEILTRKVWKRYLNCC